MCLQTPLPENMEMQQYRIAFATYGTQHANITWGIERLIICKQEASAEHGERSFPDYTYVVLIFRAGRG